MIGSHTFRLLNLGIQQISDIHALNHLRRKHGKPVAVGHDFKQIYRIQLARVNFYYIFSLHEINMIAVADPHAVSFLIPFHGQDGAEVIAVLRQRQCPDRTVYPDFIDAGSVTAGVKVAVRIFTQAKNDAIGHFPVR